MGVMTGLDSDVWVTASPSISIAGVNEYCDNYDSGAYKVYRAHTHKYWDKVQAGIVVQVGKDSKQTLTVTGDPTGGTWKVIWGGQTYSGELAINATAAQVLAAMESLSGVGAGNVLVTGPTGGPWVVEFYGTLGGATRTAITTSDTFTGGSNPEVTVTQTQTGVAWATQSAANYTFQYVGGLVTFTDALAADQVVSIDQGYYFNVAQLANCSEWQLDTKANIIDTSIFQGNEWGSSQAAMKTATGKISSFISDDTLDSQLSQLMVFVLYLAKDSGLRMECYGYLTDLDLKNSMSGVITKDVTFAADGQVYYLETP